MNPCSPYLKDGPDRIIFPVSTAGSAWHFAAAFIGRGHYGTVNVRKQTLFPRIAARSLVRYWRMPALSIEMPEPAYSEVCQSHCTAAELECLRLKKAGRRPLAETVFDLTSIGAAIACWSADGAESGPEDHTGEETVW
jgi:hypothetical protein